ncbi:aldo/keto reductase [Microbispora sp. NBRC 16548]|uniref:aldo/keto reductase n=1 Tax=Microbispora sp. NBRC 16548 TaxID=3030994 RepID=UPI0024A09018|nr:aldo/keto reductase [Microbispora sp. NBRC 16548]GLX06634.1 oxidoreductase [Microbispora sp. NBRC 16548]
MQPHDDALPLRTLGRSGITVPAVGVGCWGIGGPGENLGLPMGWSTGSDEAVAVAGLEAAWQAGARLFDTADVYGLGRSERLLGHLVARVPRKDIVLVSKVGYFAGTAEHGFEPRHMRRQLEQTLDNLRTDRLDVYFLHHSAFGDRDRWLHGAVEAMRSFQAGGLIGSVGMRGPHRFALDRLTTSPYERDDKIARFQVVFDQVRPDVLAVRDNLLCPPARSEGIFAFARQHHVGVLVNKPFAQGLLTGSYDPARMPVFGPGDHRSRKRWFSPQAVAVINEGLDRLRRLVGPHRQDLVRICLWSCLDRYAHAVVLAGFTRPEHVRTNLAAVSAGPPHPTVIAEAREVMAGVQAALDAQGQVFVDEAGQP